jgi:hypothetical protein
VIERRAYEETVAISPWWTPDHLDVTHVPLTYARPKAPWIERYTEIKKSISSDVSERMARRRDHYHSIVEPNEIVVLPPLAAPEPEPVDEPIATHDWRRPLSLVRRHAQ